MVTADPRSISIGVNLTPAGLTRHLAASNLKIHDEFLILSLPRRSSPRGVRPEVKFRFRLGWVERETTTPSYGRVLGPMGCTHPSRN